MPRYFAILPAAGRSTRMGQAKLLLPWRGAPLVEHTVRAWLEGGVDRVVAVVRADDEPLQQVLSRLPVELVIPGEPPPQMKDSVAAGLAWIESHHRPVWLDAWLLAPADVPQLAPGAVRLICDAHGRQVRAVAQPPDEELPIFVACHRARRGHPVLFPWRLAAAVSQLEEQDGVNALLRRNAVCEVEAGPEAIPKNVNTPHDYAELNDSDDPHIL